MKGIPRAMKAILMTFAQKIRYHFGSWKMLSEQIKQETVGASNYNNTKQSYALLKY